MRIRVFPKSLTRNNRNMSLQRLTSAVVAGAGGSNPSLTISRSDAAEDRDGCLVLVAYILHDGFVAAVLWVEQHFIRHC